MTKRSRRRARPRRFYRPTPIPGLMIYPTILLLNLVVRTADDNVRTDGKIPPETIDIVTAILRNTYEFPDLDLDRGRGVLISCIGQFFHPDDYDELDIANMHSQGIMDAMGGELVPQPVRVSDLRTSNVTDPADMTQGQERALALWYKQRYLSTCFVGETAQLDKLRGDLSTELMNQILRVIWEGVGLSDEIHIIPHPSFVPAARFRTIARQNARIWAEQTKQLARKARGHDVETIIGIVGTPDQ